MLFEIFVAAVVLAMDCAPFVFCARIHPVTGARRYLVTVRDRQWFELLLLHPAPVDVDRRVVHLSRNLSLQ
jgi:hypothetical protein